MYTKCLKTVAKFYNSFRFPLLYLELFYRFYKNLNSHNILITAGYGFNDRGINQKIFNWLYNPSHKIILIDPNVEDIKFKFPGYFFSNWDKNKNIRKIPYQIENVSWNTIKSNLNTINN